MCTKLPRQRAKTEAGYLKFYRDVQTYNSRYTLLNLIKYSVLVENVILINISGGRASYVLFAIQFRRIL